MKDKHVVVVAILLAWGMVYFYSEMSRGASEKRTLQIAYERLTAHLEEQTATVTRLKRELEGSASEAPAAASSAIQGDSSAIRFGALAAAPLVLLILLSHSASSAATTCSRPSRTSPSGKRRAQPKAGPAPIRSSR